MGLVDKMGWIQAENHEILIKDLNTHISAGLYKYIYVYPFHPPPIPPTGNTD